MPLFSKIDDIQGYPSMIQKFERFNSFLNKISSRFCVLLLGFMTVLAVFQVVMRYIFRSPFTWSDELLCHQLVWLAIIGSSVVLKRQEHLKLTVLRDALPGKLKWVLLALFQMLTLIFLTIVFFYGILMAGDGLNQNAPSLGVSMFIPYSSVPVGAFIMLLYSIEHTINHFRKNK